MHPVTSRGVLSVVTSLLLTPMIGITVHAHGTTTSTTGTPRVEVRGAVVRVVHPAEEAVHGPAGHTRAAGSSGSGRHTPDTSRDTFTALRAADGTYVPVAESVVAGIAAGSEVSATVDVPAPVVTTARQGGSAPTLGGSSVAVSSQDLARAGDASPEPATSALSAASLASAASTGTELTGSSTAVLHAAPASFSTDVHRVTVAVAVPKGASGTSATAAQIRAQVAAASAYWSEQSNGRVRFVVDSISPRYLSVVPCGGDVLAVWSEAAKKTGFVEGPNKHLVVSFPKEAYQRNGCIYGLASVGSGINSGGVSIVADTAWPVLTHEIGHNLGLGHAKSLRCAKSDVNLVSIPGGCSVVEYGYPWDVMAASATDGAGSLSSVQAHRIGLLGAADIVEVGDGSRTVTLQPMSRLAGVRAVRIADPKSGSVYYVEYRTRSGRDYRLYENVPNGVRVLQVDTTAYDQRGSVVLDATPSGSTSDVARQIPVGGSFRSYSGGVTVQVRSAGATASVTVTAGTPPAATKPTKSTKTATTGARRSAVAPATLVTVPAVDATAARGPAVPVRWGGGPDGARYDVRTRTLGVSPAGRPSPGAPKAWLTGTSATSATLRGTPGASVQVQARAAGSNAWSPWRTVTFAVDATAKGASSSRGWSTGRGSAFYASTYARTTTRGAWLSRPAAVTNRIDVIGTTHARGSVAHVYVDGVRRAVVDTHSARSRDRQVLASIPLTWGAHSVKIVNVPKAGAWSALVVDAVAYRR